MTTNCRGSGLKAHILQPQPEAFHQPHTRAVKQLGILAPEAARIGLINYSVPAAELDARVLAYAHKVAVMPARAVQWTKATINIGLKQLAHSIMDASIAYEALSSMTHDHREAMDARAEKRKPQFNGD